METKQGITQTVVQGAQAPVIFTGFLIVNALFLGVMIGIGLWLRSDVARLSTEVRIMQIHTENMNAIMIREGVKKPNDDQGTGPTGSH